MRTLFYLLISVMIGGCGQRKYQRYEDITPPVNFKTGDTVVIENAFFYVPEFIDGEYKSIGFSEGYRIVKIDTCEYIIYAHGSSYSMIHKANCKNHDSHN